MNIDIGKVRVHLHPIKLQVFAPAFDLAVDLWKRPSFRLEIPGVLIGGGFLSPANCNGKCYDFVVMLGRKLSVIEVNNNFIRVRKNLGPKVVLFNYVVHP